MQLISAVQKLVKDGSFDSRSASVKNPEVEEKKPRAGRATILDYKRVEEAWDDKTYKYKIVESDQSGIGNRDQFVFVARDRIGE
ncbi:hypothetical protein F66182_5647 [Fusarium sp. NRRL 66182]|nr:hypothetical protein F66182_5647 [Fusarium sp. NRRL 66182]